MDNSKYNRTYHLPNSPGTTSDDKISDDQSLLIGREIVITEKLDGENNAMIKAGVFARSHATFTESPWSRKVRDLHKRVGHLIDDGVYIFGEGMGAIHSIEYSKLTSPFYIFGVREGNVWASWDEVEEWAFILDIPTVPVLFRGVLPTMTDLNNMITKLTNRESVLGGEREGVVIRTANSFKDEEFPKRVQKWVRADHVQTDEHWTRNWKPGNINY